MQCERENGSIYSIIAKIMRCEQNEIRNLSPMKCGMTNRSYSFVLRDKHYLDLHPRSERFVKERKVEFHPLIRKMMFLPLFTKRKQKYLQKSS